MVLGALMAPVLPAASRGQQTAPPASGRPGENAELAKKLSNPISALVSVPLPPLFEGGVPASGVSDILTSFFFSPSKSGLTWGVGPVISLPSTTEPTLGTEKWSAGPTVVALKQSGPWTYGVLWNQIWSFAGNTDRSDVNQMFVQPFLAYNTKGLWTFTIQSESTVNWEADEDQWTVPVNLSVSKLSSFGPFPASYQFGFGVFAVHPEVGPSWKIRSAIVLLLPRGNEVMTNLLEAGIVLCSC